MLRRDTSLLVLTTWAAALYGQNSAAVAGVEKLIQQALAQNREILAARQRVAEARGMFRQAGIRPAPTLEVNAGSGRPLGTQGEEEYSVGYFHPVETGGKRSKRMLVAEQAVALVEADLSERTRQLVYEIKTRYIDAAASQRRSAAIEDILKVNRESYRLVDARVQRDDAAPLERQLLLVELNRTDAQRTIARGQVQSARLELERATGVSAGGIPAPVPELSAKPIRSGSLAGLQRRALETRPDLRAARTLASQSGAEVALTEAQGSPDLTLSARYARRYAQFEDPLRTAASGSPLLLKDRDNILTLGISIPLQSRKRNAGNIEAAVARQNAAKLRIEQLENTIPLEVQMAWERHQAARDAVEILNRGVLDESEKNLSVIRQAYNLGQLRLLDVLNEQRRLLETALAIIDAQSELARSRAELERAVGEELP
jgi:cobalt-zinc-cadmium efflux system outer membrane protein